MNFRILYLLVLLVSFSNCKNEPQSNPKTNPTSNKEMQQTLNVETYIRYLETDEKTEAEVIFKRNNRAFRTEGDVFFQDGLMETKSLGEIKPAYYKAERSGKYPEKFSFIWKKGETILAQWLPESNSFQQINTTSKASKKAHLSLEWTGKALEQNEQLVFLLTDKQGEVATSTINASLSTENKIKIPGVLFSGLQNGKATLNLVKKTLIKKQQDSTLFNTVIEYYTKPYNIEISN